MAAALHVCCEGTVELGVCPWMAGSLVNVGNAPVHVCLERSCLFLLVQCELTLSIRKAREAGVCEGFPRSAQKAQRGQARPQELRALSAHRPRCRLLSQASAWNLGDVGVLSLGQQAQDCDCTSARNVLPSCDACGGRSVGWRLHWARL